MESFLLYAVCSAFALLLALAAAYDVLKFIIPNYISGSIGALFFIAAFLLPVPTDWISHLGATAAVFSVGLVSYRFHVFGAGDVKLMTAVSVWAGFAGLPAFLLYTAIAGGALALALMLLRYLVLTAQLQWSWTSGASTPRLLRVGESIPYGVAIAAGGIAMLFQLPHLFA